MDYIQSNLSKDEQIKARIEHSWAAITGPIIRMLFDMGLGIAVILLFNKFSSVILTNMTDGFCTFFTAAAYLIGAMLILLGIIFLGEGIITIRCDQLVLTNKRLLGRNGFIRKYTSDILLSHVDTIIAGNGFLGAFFHYGNIAVVSPATQQGGGIFFKHITNTMEFRKAVLDQIEEVKAHEREEQARLMQNAVNADK